MASFQIVNNDVQKLKTAAQQSTLHGRPKMRYARYHVQFLYDITWLQMVCVKISDNLLCEFTEWLALPSLWRNTGLKRKCLWTSFSQRSASWLLHLCFIFHVRLTAYFQITQHWALIWLPRVFVLKNIQIYTSTHCIDFLYGKIAERHRLDKSLLYVIIWF